VCRVDYTEKLSRKLINAFKRKVFFCANTLVCKFIMFTDLLYKNF